tara:strand:+ start:239 stop:1006 length:768 start_codon:yes stop_codon:yes gene_type:complete
MIKNTINSFTDNISQKLKNPFLGTFLIVWIIRNWEFIYSLFNFDPNLSLDDRINKIKTFFIDYGIVELLITIGVSFLVLIATYFFLNLSRLVVNFFDKMITPKVYEITDKSSIVLKTVHDETHKRIELLESRVQSERELRLKTQNENEELENRIKELLDTNTKKNIENNPTKGITNKTKLLSKKLIDENKVQLFERVASDILNGNSILKDQTHITEFTTLGLIKPGSYQGGGKSLFSLTQSGNDIHENLILEKLK